MIHTLGHAIGFWHEHQRADRDDYVDVNKGNIPLTQINRTEMYSIFKRGKTKTTVPYDYSSIMHFVSTVSYPSWRPSCDSLDQSLLLILETNMAAQISAIVLFSTLYNPLM